MPPIITGRPEEEAMAVTLNPYLNFKGSAREAMEFYTGVFGGTLNLSTFADFHASEDPSEENLVMHADLEAPGGIRFMAADTPNRMEFKPGTNFSMSLSGEDEAELRSYFEKLSVGGVVPQPLEKAPWGDTFGMLTDRFGISWLVNITAPQT
jgi:PhnB protein